jgi:hypothetical protein
MAWKHEEKKQAEGDRNPIGGIQAEKPADCKKQDRLAFELKERKRDDKPGNGKENRYGNFADNQILDQKIEKMLLESVANQAAPHRVFEDVRIYYRKGSQAAYGIDVFQSVHKRNPAKDQTWSFRWMLHCILICCKREQVGLAAESIS